MLSDHRREQLLEGLPTLLFTLELQQRAPLEPPVAMIGPSRRRQLDPVRGRNRGHALVEKITARRRAQKDISKNAVIEFAWNLRQGEQGIQRGREVDRVAAAVIDQRAPARSP